MTCHCESCSKDPLPTYTEKFKRESFVREIASREGGSIRAYYNEFDPKAAAWLRQLIKNGDITQGEVDERSITEVKSGDLRGFDRVHFFAGIGTWDYCLNQAGWGNKPIWTASLPCQPFSAAGKGLGKADERHLLPHFLDLVRECNPHTIIGEQVERAIAHGWLDDLQANMEAEGYAVGCCVLGAHSIGAPHIRQRLYWVANSKSERIGRACGIGDGTSRKIANSRRYENRESIESIAGSSVKRMAHTERERLEGFTGYGDNCVEPGRIYQDQAGSVAETGGNGGLADTMCQQNNTANKGRLHSQSSCYSDVEWIYCRDNKYRPVKPGIQPLVDGTTGRMVYSSDPSTPIDANATQEARVMRLKGYGNAIQAQTAIAFIRAYMSV